MAPGAWFLYLKILARTLLTTRSIALSNDDLGATFSRMKAIRVRVQDGRITGEAPAGLPDGEVDLCLADPEDDMTEDELARLNEALAQGFDSIKAGRFRPAADVIADLRAR